MANLRSAKLFYRVLNSDLGFWRSGPKMSRRLGFFDYWKREGFVRGVVDFARHCCVRFSESRCLSGQGVRFVISVNRRRVSARSSSCDLQLCSSRGVAKSGTQNVRDSKIGRDEVGFQRWRGICCQSATH